MNLIAVFTVILEDCWGVFFYSISLRRPGK